MYCYDMYETHDVPGNSSYDNDEGTKKKKRPFHIFLLSSENPGILSSHHLFFQRFFTYITTRACPGSPPAESVELGETRRANTTPNGGPHL